MNDIQQYIIINMRGRQKFDIEDYIVSFYTDGQISSEETDYLLRWLDETYDLVLA